MKELRIKEINFIYGCILKVDNQTQTDDSLLYDKFTQTLTKNKLLKNKTFLGISIIAITIGTIFILDKFKKQK